jgi:hypothetical protein
MRVLQMKYVWIVTNDYDGDICGVFSTAAAAREFIKDEIDRWARINEVGDEELQQNYDELNEGADDNFGVELLCYAKRWEVD